MGSNAFFKSRCSTSDEIRARRKRLTARTGYAQHPNRIVRRRRIHRGVQVVQRRQRDGIVLIGTIDGNQRHGALHFVQYVFQFPLHPA